MAIPPGVFFNKELRLMVFRPRGVLDQAYVNNAVQYLEQVEDLSTHPFDRFTDTSMVAGVELDSDFVFDVSLHRRRFYIGRSPVKSAFYVTTPEAERVITIHARVTLGSTLQVQIFPEINAAAAWLEVDPGLLNMGLG